MAVRIICDQCGNKINKRNQFAFGPMRFIDDDEDNEDDETTPIKRSKKTNAINHRENIDLCDHCVSVWMARVKALTSKSDP